MPSIHTLAVRHGRSWRGAMPMLLSRRAPDHIARPNFRFWAPPLCTHPHPDVTITLVHGPCGAGTWLERNTHEHAWQPWNRAVQLLLNLRQGLRQAASNVRVNAMSQAGRHGRPLTISNTRCFLQGG